ASASAVVCRDQTHRLTPHLDSCPTRRSSNLNNAFGGAATTFNNYGTLRKSGGQSEFTNATIFSPQVVFNQLAGVIDVQNGTNGLDWECERRSTITGSFITSDLFF